MIITYEDLTKALASIGILKVGDRVADCNYCYEGKIEKLKLRLCGEKPDVIIYSHYDFHCENCNHNWDEPGQPVKPNCPKCTSEKVSCKFVKGHENK